MKEFRDYDIIFPELVYDIVNYFRVSNTIKRPAEKSVFNYCLTSQFTTKENLIQLDAVHLICENLAKKGVLTCIRAGTHVGGGDANYLFQPLDDDSFLSRDPAFVLRLNCMAYGFRYIYAAYKDKVLPIIVKNRNGKIEMGTCFRFLTGILTAKHCLEATEVSILGYTAERLSRCDILVGKDNDLDMAYVELNEPSNIIYSEAKVLDEVLVMGYPKIPMFFDFCAAERAAISSIPTRGAVASLAKQYITKNVNRLMLVTARIRGGNSGGPIIDANGAVVGVAFSEPVAEGEYDEMGYGIAYPIDVFFQMLRDSKSMHVNFVNDI